VTSILFNLKKEKERQVQQAPKKKTSAKYFLGNKYFGWRAPTY
jgi:hypothetical protein